MFEYILSVYGDKIIGALLVAAFGTLGWFFGRSGVTTSTTTPSGRSPSLWCCLLSRSGSACTARKS